MPINDFLPVKSLQLDLKNYRTIHQPNEKHAINAMISINPDRFWALLDSIVEDGYHPTENIIIQKDGKKYVVKEGNRRIAALKIALNYVTGIIIPAVSRSKIDQLSKSWIRENSKVPCAIYPSSESKIVERIVSLTHAKGEKAGRDSWNAVARARYGRDQKGIQEPGLDVLEKYLKDGKNLIPEQAERWAGDYPLTVLNEAIQKIAPHLDFASAKELALKYPKERKSVIDQLLYDVGIEHLSFNDIRNKTSFLSRYGIEITDTAGTTSQSAEQAAETSQASGKSTSSSAAKTISAKALAVASTDPKSVYQKLKHFKPKGKNREKLVTILNEARRLKIDKHAHAFCFLLRCMFEISAKAYCIDHKSAGGPTAKKNDGNDKDLKQLLRDITKHMTNDMQDKAMLKELHGAITELAKSDGILSVTSMNQLIHNPTFSVAPPDISILFGNIFPLLEEMNK